MKSRWRCSLCPKWGYAFGPSWEAARDAACDEFYRHYGVKHREKS